MIIPQQPATQQEFGTAKGWRWFIYLLAPPMILLFLAMPFLMWNKSPQLGPALGFGVLGVGMALFFLYCLLETTKAKHIITEDRLIYQGAFRRKELPLANILGYRIDQHYTHLVPKSTADPKIRISYSSENYAGLQQWFAERYPDLDMLEQQQDTDRLLQEEELGRTTEERAQALASGAQAAKWVNIVGGTVAAWLFLFPKPYIWAMGVGLLMPWLVTVVLWLYRGVIRPDEKKNSGYPSVVTALLMPSLGMALRVMLDFEILNYAPLWPQVGAVALLFGLGLLLGSRQFLFRNDGRTSLLLTVVVYAALYGFAATTAYNCAFDDSLGRRYETLVLSKHVSSGKTTTYYLEVGPWGPRTEAEDVTVTQEYYEQAAPGDKVQIYLRPGQLHVPWFTVLE
jgi:hypothetical protein